jgi:phosphate starvation-inducible membrane PsiE
LRQQRFFGSSFEFFLFVRVPNHGAQAAMPETPPENSGLAVITRLFLQVEHVLYAALGGLLALVAAVALAHAAWDAVVGMLQFHDVGRIFGVIDQLLFVLMLVEILHTVRVSIRYGTLNAEPFLIVGLIASIRRVLVITLETSSATQDKGWSDGTEHVFHASMIELGVLSVLILVMVVSIFLVRRSNSFGRTTAE